MYFQSTWCSKWLGTFFTSKWLLPWMSNRWILRLLDCENDLEHSLQVNGFSPEWVLRWLLRSPDLVNELEHSLQINGFSPEWVLRWILRSPNVVNELEHSSHWPHWLSSMSSSSTSTSSRPLFLPTQLNFRWTRSYPPASDSFFDRTVPSCLTNTSCIDMAPGRDKVDGSPEMTVATLFQFWRGAGWCRITWWCLHRAKRQFYCRGQKEEGYYQKTARCCMQTHRRGQEAEESGGWWSWWEATSKEETFGLRWLCSFFQWLLIDSD